MFYFAYGSNLDLLQMQLRCPEAQFISTARLDGYRMCFPSKSFVRDCATISVEPTMGECVWGALYEVDEVGMKRLDDREGCDVTSADKTRNRHNRVTVQVVASDDRPVVAETYIAVPTEKPGQPSPQYIAYLVASAAECGLPKSHLVKLAQHVTSAQQITANPLQIAAQQQAA